MTNRKLQKHIKTKNVTLHTQTYKRELLKLRQTAYLIFTLPLVCVFVKTIRRRSVNRPLVLQTELCFACMRWLRFDSFLGMKSH